MLTICKLFILFIIYSFIGWSMEVVMSLIRTGKFINRGFLIGPYCPIHGIGCILLIICLQKFVDYPVLVFIMSLLLCSGLEYATSYIMEKLFKARWWDYSDRRFNIRGRVCLEYMIAFGVLGTIIIYIINPYFMSLINLISNKTLYIITIILAVIYLTDLIISTKTIYTLKNTIILVAKDNTEQINEKVHEMLLKKSILVRRLRKAFPNLHVRMIEAKKIFEKQMKRLENKMKR